MTRGFFGCEPLAGLFAAHCNSSISVFCPPVASAGGGKSSAVVKAFLLRLLRGIAGDLVAFAFSLSIGFTYFAQSHPASAQLLLVPRQPAMLANLISSCRRVQ